MLEKKRKKIIKISFFYHKKLIDSLDKNFFKRASIVFQEENSKRQKLFSEFFPRKNVHLLRNIFFLKI